MNKSKSLLVFSILLVMLLTLSIVPDQTSATATEIKPVSANPSPLFTPSEASNAGINQLPPMALGVVLVGLKPGVTVSTGLLGVQASDASLSAAFADIGVQSVEPIFPNGKRSMVVVSADSGIDLSSIYRLRLAPDADILRIVRDLSANPAVVYAEPDYLAHIIATPNDPLYSGQWGLSQINAPAAWDVITGTTDVVIAVIDSGLDTSHPDLAGQLWTNPGEIVGNGIDDDNNGYVDDINGWNFVDDNTNLSDNTGHGTQVAGVIAAETNNGKGVAGVCWNCHLMIVKVTQFGGVANYSDIAAGVTYAAQKGADVINLSLGGYSNSATLRAAVEAASQTVVVVGGAGNDDRTDLFYPAAYNDNVLAVAGTTSSDTKVGTSNYGTWVDVSAPGEVITTTFSGGGYGDTSGTSMAAPFVAGLAGLLRSKNPGWSADMVRAQIIRTANDIYGLNPSYGGQLGNGRINADQAVTTAAQPLLTYQSHIVDGETNGRPEPGSTVDLDVVLFNEWANATNVQATLSTTDTYATVITGTASYEDIAVYKNKMNATSFRVSISDLTPDAYDIPFVLYVAAAGDYVTTVPFTVTTSAIQQVSGVISTDTIWRAGIEYIVTGNIMVPTGITLTIEPGTTVRVHGERSFHIEGKLVADGAADAVIQFTSATQAPSSESDYWSGILFINGGEGLFTHCWFEYLNEGAIQVNDGSLLVERSFFTKNKEDVLVVSSSGYAIVKYNRFWNNSTGGAMYPIILQGDVAFSNNLVYDNIADVGAILQPSQGIVVSNTIRVYADLWGKNWTEDQLELEYGAN
jgi:subtilisin family serine protease